MIERLQLHNFRAFEEFAASFSRSVVLVGPNNAGKSSVLAALRAASVMLRSASRTTARESLDVGREVLYLYPFDTGAVGLDEENLRWEFTDDETSFSVSFDNGAQLRAVWPPADKAVPYFYLRRADGESLGDPREIRNVFPQIGVLPPLGPLERHEALLGRKHVIENVGSRLASRHFRNQLWLLRSNGWGGHTELAGFFDYCHHWLPEIELADPELRDARYLDLFYRDDLTHRWKELVWAGDGFQMFVQVLFHLYRLSDNGAIVLDEPDAFLHPDLQRRLVAAVRSLDAQSIIATHSAEIIGEADEAAVVWMDRTHSHAVRIRDDEVLEDLTAAIGTRFDLRLAKVLRSKAVLFVEGKDMKLLKLVASALGAHAVASEHNLALVPIEGRSNWRRLEGFGWLAQNWLKGTVRGWLILDRDYHDDEVATAITSDLTTAGLATHIWSKKELENYLLIPSLVSRVTGAPQAWIEQQAAEVTEPLYEDVLFRFIQSYQEDFPDARRQQLPTLAARYQEWLRGIWKAPAQRLDRCPAKDVLADLNRRLQAAHYRTVSFETLAKRITPREVAPEMERILRAIDQALAPHAR